MCLRWGMDWCMEGRTLRIVRKEKSKNLPKKQGKMAKRKLKKQEFEQKQGLEGQGGGGWNHRISGTEKGKPARNLRSTFARKLSPPSVRVFYVKDTVPAFSSSETESYCPLWANPKVPCARANFLHYCRKCCKE